MFATIAVVPAVATPDGAAPTPTVPSTLVPLELMMLTELLPALVTMKEVLEPVP